MSKIDSPNDMVVARGTEEGLVLRIDGRNSKERLIESLRSFLTSRKRFLTGSRSILLEWLVEEPEPTVVNEISRRIQEEFGLELRAGGLREDRSSTTWVEEDGVGFDNGESDANSAASVASPESCVGGVASRQDSEDTDSGAWGDRLFQGIRTLQEMNEFPVEQLNLLSSVKQLGSASFAHLLGAEDGRIVFQTLRSGQRIEVPGTIVVVGDVNSGAEIIAGGDVIVLGILRGVAHAGAYHESGQGRFIFALELRPTQLRIGGIITRGSGGNQTGPLVPEFARADGDAIVVETYSARACAQLVAHRNIFQDVVP
jgi:septum formation inhibitor MinC